MVEKKIDKEEVWKFKEYVCRAKCFDIRAGSRVAILNRSDAYSNDIYENHRVVLSADHKELVSIVDLSNDLVRPGEVGLFIELFEELGVREGDPVKVMHTSRPASIDYIKKKMDGHELSHLQIDTVMEELMQNRLSEGELASFITSLYIRGMTDSEVVGLTQSIVKSGEILALGKKPIADKHCIGGVAGNRTTMIIVPIVAAAGVYMPKTSSRSITSAAGTADTMEVLAPVALDVSEMKEIVLKCNACIAWGGAMKLAAADDKLIRIRNPLSLDPKGVMLASILAKKKAVGAQYAVIDIPVGRGAKIADPHEANRLAHDFINIGKQLGITIEVLTTDGSDPIGNGIGPALECRDVLSVLAGGGPADLRDKSCQLAGILMELCGRCKKGDGQALAADILTSGKAMAKMRQIIELQGGNPNVTPESISIGGHKHRVIAEKTGRVSFVDNKMLSKIARAAGAPVDKGAGIYLHCEQGDKVKEGDVLFEIFAESESKLDFAIKALEGWNPIELQKFVLSTMK
jgi:AMP phosphorylase